MQRLLASYGKAIIASICGAVVITLSTTILYDFYNEHYPEYNQSSIVLDAEELRTLTKQAGPPAISAPKVIYVEAGNDEYSTLGKTVNSTEYLAVEKKYLDKAVAYISDVDDTKIMDDNFKVYGFDNVNVNMLGAEYTINYVAKNPNGHVSKATTKVLIVN